MTWHQAHAGTGSGNRASGSGTDAAAGRAPAGGGGGLGRSHPPHADAVLRTERTVVHGLVAAALIVLVVLMITVVWPAVSILWSKARPVVDTLSTSAIYVGPGVTAVDAAGAAEIATIIGTRPIAEIVLSKDDPLADDALATCVAVTDRLPRLIVQVVVDGEFENGCEGDDVAYAPGVKWEGWDFRFWLEESYATSLADGDVAELSRQFALGYDAEVKGNRLLPTEREFHPPPQRTLIAVAITAAVVVGTVLLFVLMRLATRWGFAAAARRHQWEHRRDEIDGELGDIALIMVMVRPDTLSDRKLVSAIAGVAGDYRAALGRLAAAQPGDDLEPLAESVRAIRGRLTAAGAPA
jgi:hypothetical protein